MSKYLTVKEASEWASNLLKREVSVSNIVYLIQYGKVKKHGENGSTLIDFYDLQNYYGSYHGKREITWKNKLGNDLNWHLSFDHLREKDTTKHVHRLHPYKGKFIPQLVEYFFDQHTDEFKKDIYFYPGDIVLDPFVGSGTTLVQANELGIHSIGIDISRFNTLISEVKLLHYDLVDLASNIQEINNKVISFEVNNDIKRFEEELIKELNNYNIKYFPSPEFKYKVNRHEINEEEYGREKEKEFLKIYSNLIKKYNISLKQKLTTSFLDKWYIDNVRKEIDFAFGLIKKIEEDHNKKILSIILSRSIRSCRATTHSDLATLKAPQITTYYCYKHKKICKPIFSIKNMFSRYAFDTLNRLQIFDKIRSDSKCLLLSDDSRVVDLAEGITRSKNKKLIEVFKDKRIKGIFTSPPYVGQIDYHEQHAYAYDLLGFERRDKLEIGPLYKGQGLEARASYIEGISKVLLNCRKYLTENFDIFLVANDKYNLYPEIANRSNMRIVNRFKRPVLNRTERDRTPYSEIIFHIKENGSD